MNTIPKHAQAQVLKVLQDAYRKHAAGDQSIGWDELSDRLANALCEIMGDEGFIRWLQASRAERQNVKDDWEVLDINQENRHWRS